MKKLAALGACALLSSACALPHGSFARPVEQAGKGSSMIAVGGMIPVAAAGAATSGSGDVSFSSAAEGLVVIPAASYDFAISDRHYIGLELSLLNTITTSESTGSDAFGLFVNPRWEMAVATNFSLVADLNIAYFGDGDTNVGFLTPAFGVRGYLPTGLGGLVITQEFSTAIITVALPGSLAYDIPIPIGDGSAIHFFPEFRWDPTFFFIGDIVDGESTTGGIALFSAGLTVMIEI